jgi:hypothetical protein
MMRLVALLMLLALSTAQVFAQSGLPVPKSVELLIRTDP